MHIVKMRPVATHVAWSVCLSVCLFVTTVSPKKLMSGSRCRWHANSPGREGQKVRCIDYWQSKTFTSKQRRASAMPATCHILAPPLARDENGKEPGRNRRECRQREDRIGERIGRQREGTRNVKRCIVWVSGNGRQREEIWRGGRVGLRSEKERVYVQLLTPQRITCTVWMVISRKRRKTDSGKNMNSREIFIRTTR